MEGRNPPDEITVIAKFSELNDLIPRMFRIIKIDIVNPEYSKRILIDCFKISAELKDKKLVKDFFNFRHRYRLKKLLNIKNTNHLSTV